MSIKTDRSKPSLSVKALERVVNVAESTGKWGVAAKALETLCDIFPNMPRLRHKQALMFLQMKDEIRAAQAFLMAVDFYLESGSRSMAIAILNQAVKAIPGNVELSGRLDNLYKGSSWKPLSDDQKLFHYQELKSHKETYKDTDEILGTLRGLNEDEFSRIVKETEEDEKVVQKKTEPKPKEQPDSPQLKVLELLKKLKANSRFIRSLQEDALVQLAQSSELKKFSAKSKIGFDQKFVYLIVDGEVESSILQNGKDRSLNLFKTGELIFPIDRQVSESVVFQVEAKSASDLLLISRNFYDLVQARNDSLSSFLEEQNDFHQSILLLRSSSLFGDMSLERLHKIRSLFVKKKFQKNSLVIEEGSLREPLFYFLLDGKVSVYRKFKSDLPVKLSELFASDFFGERGFLASTTSMATVKADTDIELLALSRSQIDHMLELYPKFVERLSAVSENRVRIALSTEMSGSVTRLEIMRDDLQKERKTLPPKSVYESVLFSDLSSDRVDEILKACPLEKFEAGSILIKKGAKSNELFLIRSGQVKEYDYQDDGEECLNQIHTDGHIIGEEGFFRKPISPSFFEVMETTEVYRLSYDQFRSISDLIPSIKTHLYEQFLKRYAARILEKSVFFQDLSEAHRALILEEKIQEYEAEQFLIQQGDSRDPHLFIMLDGELAVSKSNLGNSIELAKLAPGQIFGESAIVTGLSSSASVQAITKSLVIKIPEKKIKSLLKEIPTFGAYVVRVFRERVYFNIETMISGWRNRMLDAETLSPEEAAKEAMVRNIIGSNKSKK